MLSAFEKKIIYRWFKNNLRFVPLGVEYLQVGIIFDLFLESKVMQKRVMFISGSVWEAELFIQRYSSITHIPWEDQKTFLYSQPRIFENLQCIFVVTGYDASHAKRALNDALDQFQYVDHVIGHGFCSGLIKHSEAGDTVWTKELMLASYPEVLKQPQPLPQNMHPTPVWTKVLALKKQFTSEIEKAAVYASSNMEVMDPICGIWYKVLSQKTIPFSMIKSLLDGGNELGLDFYIYLDAKGQFEKMKVLKNSITKPLSGIDLHSLKKFKAKELTEKSHQMIRSLCMNIAQGDEEHMEETVPSLKLDSFSA